MSLTDQVQELVAAKSQELSKDESFQKLRDFYEEKKKDGVAKPPQYDLPQVDTIGRSIREPRP